jgi:hypothetical protein
VYAYRGVRPRASRTLHLGRLRFQVIVDYLKPCRDCDGGLDNLRIAD